MEVEQIVNPFEIGEQVDCKDTVNKWLNAEIIAKRQTEVRVHYTSWSSKYDEWIDLSENRVLKQWEKGMKIQLFNRLDVQYIDNEQNIRIWLEAVVQEIDQENENKVFIHFKEYKKKYDHWVYLTDILKVAEVSTHSKADGKAGKVKSNPKFQINQKKFMELLKQKEESFREQLKNQYDWSIKEVEGDGNCLFRSVSHQIYKTEDNHDKIRQFCMDYIEINKDYFKDFLLGSDKTFADYVSWKRQDAVWGDNVEIQAIREMYQRPVEIYAYGTEPLRTFSEATIENSKPPIKLSYHGLSHYNSIQWDTQEPEASDAENSVQQNNDQIFGKIEEEAIKTSQSRQQKMQEENQMQQEIQQSETQMYNTAIQQARKDFEKIGIRDMDDAIKDSFNMYMEKTKEEESNQIEQAMTEDAIVQVQQQIQQEQEKTVQESIQEYEQQQLKWAQEQSQPAPDNYEQQLKQAQLLSNKQFDDDIQKVLQESMNQYQQNNNNMPLANTNITQAVQESMRQYQEQQHTPIISSQNSQTNFFLVGDPMDNPIIQQILNNDLNMDISVREAVAAYEKYGEDMGGIMTYFCEKKLM